MREKDGPTNERPASPYVRVKDWPVKSVPTPSSELVYCVTRPPARAVSESHGMLLNGKRHDRVRVEPAVGPVGEVPAAVDEEPRDRREQRQVERALANRRGAVEELDRGETLLDDGRRVEGLALLEADVQGVRAEVLRKESPRDDLARRVQGKGALEVLQVLLVRIVPDRQHSAKPERQVVGDVIEAQLPARLGLDRVDAERAVGKRAEAVAAVGRRLRKRHADRGRLVADHVALEEAGRLVRRAPARLDSPADRAVGERVELRRDVRRPARDPVVGEPEVAAPLVAVADAGHEHARRPVLLGGPDEVGRVEDRDRPGLERDVLHAGVVVERDRRLRQRERPLRVRHVAGREDAVVDAVGRLADLLDRVGDNVEGRREVRRRLLENPGLRVEAERAPAAREARRPLIDDDVPGQDGRLGREVVPRRVRLDLDVLVLDDDLFRALPELVLLELDGLLRVEADLAALLGRLELDLEVGPLLEARLEGIALRDGVLREGERDRDGESDGSGAEDLHASMGRTLAATRKAASVLPRTSSTVDAGGELRQLQAGAAGQDVEDAEVRDDAVNAAPARQRQRAALQDLLLRRLRRRAPSSRRAAARPRRGPSRRPCPSPSCPGSCSSRSSLPRRPASRRGSRGRCGRRGSSRRSPPRRRTKRPAGSSRSPCRR